MKNILKSFFSVHKTTFIICCLFVLIGVVSGAYTIIKYSGNVELDNIFDKNILYMIKGTRGLFGIFFSYLLIYVLICAILIFLNFKPWMMSLTFISLFVLGYLVGYNATIIIILFGFIGLVNVLIIYIPLVFIWLTIIVLIGSIAIKRNLIIKKYGCSYYENQSNFNLYKVYMFLFFIGVVILFIKSLLLPVIRITIIVN